MTEEIQVACFTKRTNGNVSCINYKPQVPSKGSPISNARVNPHKDPDRFAAVHILWLIYSKKITKGCKNVPTSNQLYKKRSSIYKKDLTGPTKNFLL